MVVYELLSQRFPFDDQPFLNRNQKVKDGERPTLQASETRTLIQLQDLMRICWDEKPENRPRMEQVVQWIQTAEFERLRVEIALKEVKSITCACVCRILPEHKSGNSGGGDSHGRKGLGFVYGPDGRIYSENTLGDIGNLDSLIQQYSTLVPNNMLSLDSFCIESMEGKKYSYGEDVYQFTPSKLKEGNGEANVKAGVVVGTTDVGLEKERGTTKEVGLFHPYTQIWMCGRDKRKGLLQIFTYTDGYPGQYVSYSDVEKTLCTVLHALLGDAPNNVRVS